MIVFALEERVDMTSNIIGIYEDFWAALDEGLNRSEEETTAPLEGKDIFGTPCVWFYTHETGPTFIITKHEVKE